MEKLGIKATLYDLVGYIIPGLVLIIGNYSIYAFSCFDCSYGIETIVKIEMSLIQCIALLLASYIVGHIIAALGAVFCERKIFKRMFSRISEFHEKENYRETFASIVGHEIPFTTRNLAAFSEEHTRSVYSTAFVFLSIYGFCRNVFVALTIVFFEYVLVFGITKSWAIDIAFAISILALLYNYLRFKKYYVEHLCASLPAYIAHRKS